MNGSNPLTSITSFSLSPDLPQLEAQTHLPSVSSGSRFNWILPHGKEANPSTLQRLPSARGGDSSENAAPSSKAEFETGAVKEEGGASSLDQGV